MLSRIKSLVKHWLRPPSYYQVLLVVRDCAFDEICGFEFRIDQNPTDEEMKRLSKISWKQCGGISTWYTCCDLIHRGTSKDSRVGTTPYVPSYLIERHDTHIRPITSINIID
jgi:hypothetical protein